MGYDFKTSSALSQITKCNKPMLFIHGEKDSYIPPEMCHTLYSAFPGEKDMYIAPDAGHAESMDYDPDTYFDRVLEFIGRL